jgi:rod shape-determining protein MreB and related proteins
MSTITNWLGRSLSRTFYVRIARNRMHVRHVESGREISVEAEQAFTGSRLLVAEFTIAQGLLKQAIRKLSDGFRLAPVLVLHPLELVEDGLSESEERLLLDLGYGVGAQHVTVVTEALSDTDVMQLTRQCHRLRA